MNRDYAIAITSIILIFLFLPVLISGMPPPPAVISPTITIDTIVSSNTVKLGDNVDVYTTIKWNYQGWMVADMIYAYQLLVQDPTWNGVTGRHYISFQDITSYNSGANGEKVATFHDTVNLNILGNWNFWGQVQDWKTMDWGGPTHDTIVNCVVNKNDTSPPPPVASIRVEVYQVNPDGSMPPSNGAKVRVWSSANDFSSVYTTSSSGIVTTPKLSPGEYTVEVAKIGYQDNVQYVSVSSIQETIVFYMSPQQMTIMIAANPKTIDLGEQSTLIVTVMAGDAIVSTTPITLSATGGYLSSLSGSTDIHGQFVTKFSSSASGTFTISARVNSALYGVEVSSTQIIVSTPSQTFTLTIGHAGDGSGNTNPAYGTYTQRSGMSLTVTATPDSSSDFSYWVLDGSSDHSNPITVNFDKDHILVAIFTPKGEPPPPELTWWDYLINFLKYDCNWWYSLLFRWWLPI